MATHDDDFAGAENALLSAISDGSRQHVADILAADNGDLLMRALLMSSVLNADKAFNHDADILPDANELLGPSVQRLHLIQVACLLGDEEIALDILEYVAKQCELPENAFYKRMFLNQDWGNGNTTLHLASFLGMADLVKRLIELGANVVRKNERKYSPIDCADDDKTRLLLLTLPEEENRMPQSRNLPKSKSTDSLRVFVSENILNKPQRASTLRSTTPTSSLGSLQGSNDSIVKDPISPRRGILSTSTDVLHKSAGSILLRSISPRTPSPINRRKVSFDPHTMLFSACETGDLTLLINLLDNPNYSLSVSKTLESREVQPIHVACAHGHLSLVECLVIRGSDVNCVDWQGWTPLHAAADGGYLDTIEYLCSLPQTIVDVVNGDGEDILSVIDDEDDDGIALKKDVEDILKQRQGRINGQITTNTINNNSTPNSKFTLSSLSTPKSTIITTISPSTTTTNLSPLNGTQYNSTETTKSSAVIKSSPLATQYETSDPEKKSIRTRPAFHTASKSPPRSTMTTSSSVQDGDAISDDSTPHSTTVTASLNRARVVSRGRDNKMHISRTTEETAVVNVETERKSVKDLMGLWSIRSK